jgi:hypothetical protein
LGEQHEPVSTLRILEIQQSIVGGEQSCLRLIRRWRIQVADEDSHLLGVPCVPKVQKVATIGKKNRQLMVQLARRSPCDFGWWSAIRGQASQPA